MVQCLGSFMVFFRIGIGTCLYNFLKSLTCCWCGMPWLSKMQAGLFVYDIFWVFFTPVMVSVAKSFDAPIKVCIVNHFYVADSLNFPFHDFVSCCVLIIKLPYLQLLFPTADAKRPFSMLGLGDIVIPGITSIFIKIHFWFLPVVFINCCRSNFKIMSLLFVTRSEKFSIMEGSSISNHEVWGLRQQEEKVEKTTVDPLRRNEGWGLPYWRKAFLSFTSATELFFSLANAYYLLFPWSCIVFFAWIDTPGNIWSPQSFRHFCCIGTPFWCLQG